jgi:predicted molibdopterin-dependent oxidoreductase YjgC
VADAITLQIDGDAVTVPARITVAAAVARAGITRYRTSVCGESRSPLCGMGICFECRVTVNGEPHCRSCQLLCQPGMDIRTDEPLPRV